MFILKPSETFKCKVVTNIPMEKGGWQELSFFGIWERSTEAEREELMNLPHVDLIRRKLKGWEMEDPQRNPIPFDDANLADLLLMSGACRDAVLAYWKHNAGAKEKN